MARYLTEKSNQVQFMNDRFGDSSNLYQGAVLIIGFLTYLIIEMTLSKAKGDCDNLTMSRITVYTVGSVFLVIGLWKVRMHYNEKSMKS